METLVTATINASAHLEMADDIGTIEAGKYADIIALDGNPLEDVAELMDVDFVMQGGTVHKSE
jgi:imidazolonepropionase-like amidohydrolase